MANDDNGHTRWTNIVSSVSIDDSILVPIYLPGEEVRRHICDDGHAFWCSIESMLGQVNPFFFLIGGKVEESGLNIHLHILLEVDPLDIGQVLGLIDSLFGS